MISKLKRYMKQEVVMVISLSVAIFSMFFVPPNPEYMEYIDFSVLAILFCLMLVVSGFIKEGLFDIIARRLFRITKKAKGIGFLLVNLTFFSAMFVTNDVALLTFVPLTIGLYAYHNHKSMIMVIVMETIGANLGSMMTPIGNPQNLYLFSHFQMNLGEFFMIVLPVGLFGYLLVVLPILLGPNEVMEFVPKKLEKPSNKMRFFFYFVAFVICVLTVLRILDYRGMLILIVVGILLIDKNLFCKVDYSLLITFMAFFIFVGNIGNIAILASLINKLIEGRELLSAVILSQLISNVPAAVMLSGFSENAKSLLLGTNIGGLGTLVASLASLISFKLYTKSKASNPKKYIAVFSLWNLVILVFILLFVKVVAQNTTTTVITEDSIVIKETTAQVKIKEDKETLATSEPQELSIIMVGDVLLHTNINQSGLMPDGTYQYDHLFENVKEEVQAADLAIVNQEVILGGTDLGLSGYPTFNGAFEVGDALVNAGFDVVLHATNHALDKGKTGLLNCLDFWNKTYPDVKIVGIYNSQKASENICIYEKNGISVAILNYTYGTNGISAPASMPFAVNMLSEEKVIEDINKAEEIADFTILCPHWGTEYSHEASKSQEKWASIFLENGVDLVLGTHPHVVEPVEWLEDENGNKMLIYYSLGNFINSTSGEGSKVADRMLGLMAQITLIEDTKGTVTIKEYGAEPLVTQMLTGQGQITTYKLSEYTKELADKNEIIARDPAFSLEYCKKLCKTVLGKLYQEQ